MPTALLLISFQSNYFSKKGRQTVKGAKKSAKSAVKLLEHFRENKLPIIHILHTGKLEDLSAEKLQPLDLLEPKHEESTLVTNEENAFQDQKLGQILKDMQVDQLLFAGLTTENQIFSTVKGALQQGYSCTVAQDACAASTFKFNGEKLKAENVHQLIIAILENSDVEITTAKEFIKSEQKKLKKLKKAADHQAAMEEAAKIALQEANEQDTLSTPSKNGRKKTNGSSGKIASSPNPKVSKRRAGVKTKATTKAVDSAIEEVKS